MAKESKKSQNELTIIGMVKEIGIKGNTFRVGIASGKDMYEVVPNEEGKNLLYEVGNKVETTGIITITKKGLRQIAISAYEVFETDEDDFEEFGIDLNF
jgi:hypothetical protein